MLVLHGCTQQSTSLRADANLEPAAEAYGIVMALPQVPNGGVIAGCWDYYGPGHTRSNKHNGAIFEIVAALKSETALEVDPDQVYIAGLSSGAGQAAVSGCLAPDVFAGVGINAGPMVGTASSQASTLAGTTAQGVSTCRAFAGTSSGHFDTQLASIIYGSMDFIVAKGYGQRNADVLRTIYSSGQMLPASSLDVSMLPGFEPAGTGTLFSDAEGLRIQLVEVTGMGHAFPAGSGDGFELNFIAKKGPAWPMMLAELFSMNNRRIDPNSRPLPSDAGPMAEAGAPREDAGRSDAEVVVDADAGLVQPPDAEACVDGSEHADATAFADAGVSGEAPEESEGCRCIANARGSGLALDVTWASLLLGLMMLGVSRRRRPSALR